MTEKTADLSPCEGPSAIEVVDSYVNGETEPNPKASSQNNTDRSIPNVIDTINSLKEQVSRMTTALINLKDHVSELEARMDRLESQREEFTGSGSQDEFESFLRSNRAQLALLDLEMLEILGEDGF